MNTKLKYGLAALGLAVSMNVNAALLGTAIMEIENIRFVEVDFTDPNNPQNIGFLSEGDFDIAGGVSAGTFSFLNGAPGDNNGFTPSGTDPFATVDRAESDIGTLPAGYAPPNDYSRIPAGIPTTEYALSDQELGGNGFEAPGGFSNTRADIALINPGDGGAITTGEANASIEFTPSGDIGVGILFDFRVYSKALTTELDENVVTATNDFTVSLTGGDLASNISISAVGSQATVAFGTITGAAGIVDEDSGIGLFVPIAQLTSNVTYQFGLAARSNVSAVKVPEPATMALIGLGLAGAGFASRKKRMKAAV